MTARHVHRRPTRQPATVVLSGAMAYVEGADRDVVQLALLDGGLDHTWTGTRWTVPATSALALAAALRAAGLSVRLSSGGAL